MYYKTVCVSMCNVCISQELELDGIPYSQTVPASLSCLSLGKPVNMTII